MPLAAPRHKQRLAKFATDTSGQGRRSVAGGTDASAPEAVLGTWHHRQKDHPRVCGEDEIAVKVTALNYGSPPRVRGALQRRVRRPDLGRITPACAGRTRACGLSSAPGRITPACAGRTSQGNFPHHRVTDHPRVCGEDDDPGRVGVDLDGSPPRVRGGLCRHLGHRRADRITPACAGRTTRVMHTWLYCTDHPRVCGEDQDRAALAPAWPDHPRVCGDCAVEHDRITRCAGRTTS